MTLDRRLTPAPGVVARPVPDGSILVDLERGRVWELNRLGTEIWALLDGQRLLSDVLDVLKQRYEVAPDVLTQDLLRLADDLLAQGMVTA